MGNSATNALDPWGHEAVGHHWVPVSVIKEFSDKMTPEARCLAGAAVSGPLVGGHCFETVNGVTHSKYIAAVRAEFATFFQEEIASGTKITAERMEQFINRLLSRKARGLSKDIIKYNKGIIKRIITPGFSKSCPPITPEVLAKGQSILNTTALDRYCSSVKYQLYSGLARGSWRPKAWMQNRFASWSRR